MIVLSGDPISITIQMTRHELSFIASAINEALELEDPEFAIRVGWQKWEAIALHEQLLAHTKPLQP